MERATPTQSRLGKKLDMSPAEIAKDLTPLQRDFLRWAIRVEDDGHILHWPSKQNLKWDIIAGEVFNLGLIFPEENHQFSVTPVGRKVAKELKRKPMIDTTKRDAAITTEFGISTCRSILDKLLNGDTANHMHEATRDHLESARRYLAKADCFVMDEAKIEG